ncbi:telomere length regulation protein-domain-containing protein [Xylogone sp. PMI_703]|nr:telomere length regulation protein-domain-containing protein [Xylogone sp. PMI_703]
MEGLVAVSTSYRKSSNEERDTFVELAKAKEASPTARTAATTPGEALEILRHEPDYETLINTLKYLKHEDDSSNGFKITSPSPVAAQLVQVIVSDIIPNYWTILQESGETKTGKKNKSSKKSSSPDISLLLACIRSVSGLGAIILRLRSCVQQAKENRKDIGASSAFEVLPILLDALTALIEGDNTVQLLLNKIYNNEDSVGKQKALWQECLALIAGGRVIGMAAEAEDILSSLSKGNDTHSWIGDGLLYSKWLGRNIARWARELPDGAGAWIQCGELMAKSLKLGYTESIVKEILKTLILGQENASTQFTTLLNKLKGFEQNSLLQTILKLISKAYLSTTIISEDNDRWWHTDAGLVAAVAGLIQIIINGNELRKEALLAWLTGPNGAGVGDSISIRRAAITALSNRKEDLVTVLEKSLQQYGDQLYIKHTSTLQQEVHAQVLLLAAGYVHRTSALRLSMLMRTGKHLSVISNRLAASSPRARFLGMVVGEALSSLVDKNDKLLDFKVEEMNTAEAKWYKGLVTVSDKIGSVELLKSGSMTTPRKKAQKTTSLGDSRLKSIPKIAPNSSKIVSIEEVETDDEESDDEGLTPYMKPDSDEEDSDEDPTLITRNKPTAPVYIRDLISYLRDTENYDRQKLALVTAAPLISRKANFGTEVTSHIEELATLLVGLQDKYEIENFQEMRLQGMIAVLKAQPLKMGQWFSKTFFDGDYSISQRATVLTTLGLGARELGGFGADDAKLTSSARPLPDTSFPSKILPNKMHRIYAPPEDQPISKVSAQLSDTMIAPLAAEVADKVTGPQILKIRTFSSRMKVEAQRKKPITNQLAKIVADGFFFPLTGRFFIHLKAYGSSRHSNIAFQPYLLTLFIKTLSLLLHASGPNTLSLPQMTAEFWDLLLSLRAQAVGDVTVTEALLFAFLTILEVNEDKRRLVEAQGRQLTETQEWVGLIFERTGAGGSEEDEKVRVLAAACLVRVREVVEKYQALLIGDIPIF